MCCRGSCPNLVVFDVYKSPVTKSNKQSSDYNCRHATTKGADTLAACIQWPKCTSHAALRKNTSTLKRVSFSLSLLHLGNDGPDSDGAVGHTGEQGLSVGGPSQGKSFRGLGVVAREGFGSEFVDDRLGLEVEDLDARLGSGAQPVSVGREDERVDNVSGFERVQVLAVVEVPEHGDTVLATGSGQGSIGGDGEGVDVTSVAEVVGLQLASVKLPNLLMRNISNNVMQTKTDSRKVVIRDLGDVNGLIGSISPL
jgi:hypothetical protein